MDESHASLVPHEITVSELPVFADTSSNASHSDRRRSGWRAEPASIELRGWSQRGVDGFRRREYRNS